MPAWSQTFDVIHEFQGPEGYGPESGLRWMPPAILRDHLLCHESARHCFSHEAVVWRWLLTTLYYFNANLEANGLLPQSGVVFGPGGAIYGTTSIGGSYQYCLSGCGVFYVLRPPQNPCRSIVCLWTETVPYRFTGQNDPLLPGRGNLMFDSTGNVYGVTGGGGDQERGTVYKFTKSNGVWVESVIHIFGGGADGSNPVGGVVMDSSGTCTEPLRKAAVAQAAGLRDAESSSSSALPVRAGRKPSSTPFRKQTPLRRTPRLLWAHPASSTGEPWPGGRDNGGVTFELSRSGGS